MEKDLILAEQDRKNILFETVFGLIWLTSFLAYLNFFQSSSIIFLLFFTVLALLIFKRPEIGGPMIIISLMVFERWFCLVPLTVFGSTVKIYLLDVVMILTFFAVLFQNKLSRNLIPSKITVPLVIFFAAIVGWAGFSFVRGGDQALIISALKNFIFYPGLSLAIIFLSCRTLAQWERLVKSFLVGGFLIIFFIIAGIILGKGIWSDYTPLSTTGTRLLAATHAFFLLLPIFLLIVLSAFKKSFFKKWDIVILFIWIIGLIVSLFRNLWIGMVVGLGLIFFAFNNSQRQKFFSTFFKIFSLIIICVVLLIWFSYLLSGDNSILSPHLKAINERIGALNPISVVDESAKFRLAAWKEAEKIFIQNPFFGIGFGQNLQFSLENNDYEIAVRELHNDYVAFILQLGILGFWTFIFLLLSVFKKGWQNFKKADNNLKPYLIALLAFIFSFFFLSAMGTYWETNFFLVYFWLAVGLTIVAEKFIKEQN